MNHKNPELDVLCTIARACGYVVGSIRVRPAHPNGLYDPHRLIRPRRSHYKSPTCDPALMRDSLTLLGRDFSEHRGFGPDGDPIFAVRLKPISR